MTQEVQPLTWQKRTNLEEHQQFFAKINEIIANLAPTVNEAEAAIAQANQAIASANAAINTANAASANADAASQQAQTAATTVAGYDGRLTAAEGDITALGTRMTAVETKNNQQDTVIAGLQDADANNVKITGEHAIGNYAVLLTGNQDISGIKYMLSGPKGKDNRYDVTVAPSNIVHFGSGFSVYDKNDVSVCGIYPQLWTDGTIHVFLTIRNKNGTTKFIPLGVGD